jgi:NAD(P)-dependent dehydrogenase (short-subunit alcohol dehydrogenase family)
VAGRKSSKKSQAVLITGCSSGIGRACAELFARRGWTVYASARRPDALAELAALGCRTLALDVTSEESMRAAVDAVSGEQGAVGVLVNNAGYSQSGAVEEVPIEAVRKQFETNLIGAVRLIQLVLPGMRGQGWGRIVNVSSMGGRLTLPGGAFYHASKFALEAVSDVLRFEARRFGIDVALVEPGVVKTAFGVRATETASEVADPGSPYFEYNQAIAATTRDAYEGRLAMIAAPPEAVARAVFRAASSRRPRTRYVVTAHARAGLAARRLLPDRAWDAALSVVYPRPGR